MGFLSNNTCFWLPHVQTATANDQERMCLLLGNTANKLKLTHLCGHASMPVIECPEELRAQGIELSRRWQDFFRPSLLHLAVTERLTGFIGYCMFVDECSVMCRALAIGGNLQIIKRLLAAGLSPLELVRGSSALHLAFGAPEELQSHRLVRKDRDQSAVAKTQQLLCEDIHKIIRAMISSANTLGIDLNQVPRHSCFGAHAA